MAVSSQPDHHAELVEQALGLLRQINVHGDQFVAQFSADHGLHRTDLNAVAHVAAAERRGEPISPSALAELLRLRPSAVTAVIDRLENVGHLHRSRHHGDRRRTDLVIDDQARVLLEQFFEPLGEAWRTVARGFSEAELETVVRFLGLMDAAIEAEAERL